MFDIRSDTLAVTDIVGSIMLVGITVASAAAFGFAIMQIPAPEAELSLHTELRVRPGDDALWGTGDETIELRHLGGEALPQDILKLQVTIDGVTETFTGPTLGFPGDTLEIGETWSQVRFLNRETEVSVRLIHTGGRGTAIVSDASDNAGGATCTPDTSAPGSILSQSPADLNSVHANNPVTITIQLADACSGIDTSAALTLTYTLGQNSPKTMTYTGSDTWEATIDSPAGGWETKAGEILKYQVTGLKDTAGNTAASRIHTDLVELIGGAATYASSITAGSGTVADFPNSQDDNGLLMVLTESLTGAGGSETLNANAVTKAHAHWEGADKVYTQDGGEAKYTRNQERSARWAVQDPTNESGTVKTVKVHARQEIKDRINDGWQLAACIQHKCSTFSDFKPGTTTWSQITFDATSKRPGGGTWTWQDVRDLEVLVVPRIKYDGTNINEPDGDYRIDHVFATVERTDGQALDVQVSFAAPATATTHSLEWRTRSIGEAFELSVWNGTGWAMRSPDLTSTTLTLGSSALTSSEYALGSVEVRIRARATAPLDQGALEVDYIRVVTGT